MVRIRNYIDGKLCEPVSSEYLDVVDPATGQVYAQAPASDGRDVELAVADLVRLTDASYTMAT